tara:strand:+ start:458 stop:682 length:225 start_codon:yes stop_codon:yes gene_type:complete
MSKITIITLLVLFSLSSTAYAYIGPGMGGGIILATIGIVIAIFAAIFGIIWFPIKRLIQKRKEKKQNKISDNSH